MVILVAIVAILAIWTGTARAVPEDRASACRELLDAGEYLGRTSDTDRNALGREKIGQAARVCASPDVPAELRARALLDTTIALPEEQAVDEELRAEAVALLRSEAPDSPLLPKALGWLATSRFLGHRYDESLQLILEALEERERIFGAQRYAEEGMSEALRLFGLADGTTVAVASTLIAVLEVRGLTAEAEQLHEKIAPHIDLENPVD
jgi:hypothetical protein